METARNQIEETIIRKGLENTAYLDDGYDTHVFSGTLNQKEVLIKAYHQLAQSNEVPEALTVLKWYFEIGKKVRTDLKKTPNPLDQKIKIDGQDITLNYACADFGLLTQQDQVLISLVRHPIPGKSLADGISGLGLQDHWSETPPSDIERRLKDLANTTLQDLASRLNFPGQKLDPTNVKLHYDQDSKVLNITFTDIYARMLKAYL